MTQAKKLIEVAMQIKEISGTTDPMNSVNSAISLARTQALLTVQNAIVAELTQTLAALPAA